MLGLIFFAAEHQRIRDEGGVTTRCLAAEYSKEGRVNQGRGDVARSPSLCVQHRLFDAEHERLQS